MLKHLITQTVAVGRRHSYAIAMTIGQLFELTAQEFPESELVFPTERCTYEELGGRVNALARSLRALGVGRRDSVGLLMVPGTDNIATIGAIAKLGAIAVPVNVRFKPRELSHVITDGDLTVMLVSPACPPHADYPAMVRDSLPSLGDSRADAPLRLPEAPKLRSLVLMGPGEEPGYIPRQEFDRVGDTTAQADVDRLAETVLVRSPAIIMYTSGTEAKPKGCLLSHEALTRSSLNAARSRFELTSEDRMWNPLPLFHCGGIVLFLTCFSAGTSFVHAGFFDPAVSIRQLDEERCTIAHPAFETIWLAVLNHPDFDPGKLERIRLILTVGVPERMRAMHDRMPRAAVFTSFGATESSAHLALTDPDDPLEPRLRGSATPMPGMEVRVIDPETGVELPAGVDGEVLYRGPGLFDGYHRSPELNAEYFDEDGWFHSKDIGVCDEDGRLTFRSRLKDMLKVGGENVGAAEIEGVIAEHPEVVIVQVVAAPDARYTEIGCAYVQLKPGSQCRAEDIVATCIGKIANFKVPRYVRFVEEWPMSGTKIRKAELREMIRGELETAGIVEAPALSALIPAGLSQP